MASRKEEKEDGGKNERVELTGREQEKKGKPFGEAREKRYRCGGRGKHGDARLGAWAAYTDGERRLLPIVHVEEKRGSGLVQVAVGQQLLQLLHQVVFVRGAQTAELVQQVLVQIVVEIHDRCFSNGASHNGWLNAPCDGLLGLSTCCQPR